MTSIARTATYWSGSRGCELVDDALVAELEGFHSADDNPILFIGATNEPWALDPAVMRPGRSIPPTGTTPS